VGADLGEQVAGHAAGGSEVLDGHQPGAVGADLQVPGECREVGARRRRPQPS
jgi:hypothetical protein